MVSLSFIAGALLGSAVTLAAIAARSLRPRQLRPRYVIAAGVVASFALAAGLLYVVLGGHHAASTDRSAQAVPAGANARSMELEVAALEARLARGGGSTADWNLLAQAYEFLGRPEDARPARAHLGGASAQPVSEMSVAALAAAAPDGPAAGGTAAAEAAPLESSADPHPADAQGWLRLADLRRTQHDFAGARIAYAKVVELEAMSAQSWADYADVLGSLAGGALNGEAAQAIDHALALDPKNPKALWLKASAEYQQRRYAAALGWWKKLRAELPADSPDAGIIDDNIAESARLAAAKADTSGASGPVPAGAAAGGAAEVSGTVSLDGRFADRVPPDSTLFIYAKAADSPGPPLAVVRTTAHSWPVAFRLDDSMAMMPSRRLSQFGKVVVEARISRSGQATPAPGDFYVTSPALAPSPGARVALVINREIG
jgi:cytochrome c-type biogenesis protein CcmH